MPGEDIELLLAEYIERRDAGEGLTAEEFLQQHPEAGEDLRVALHALDDTEQGLPAAGEAPPRRIGPYEVLGTLGRGGMARVLRVQRDGDPPRQYAMKLLAESVFLNPRALERFRRESEVLISLRHEGIVRCHEFGKVGAQAWLVMDLVDGDSLDQCIARAREEGRSEAMPFGEILGIGTALCDALGALHRQGLLHRDMKPSNVVLTKDRKPILIDFGLVGGEALATMTGSGDILGTPAYMAPEQAAGLATDARTDLYGLAGILYELATLQAPHGEGDSASVMQKLRMRPVASARRRSARVPRGLASVLGRALSHAPKWRYQSAEDFREALMEAGDPAGKPRGPGTLQRLEEFWQFRKVPASLTALALLLALTLLRVFLAGPSEGELREKRGQLVQSWIEDVFDRKKETASDVAAQTLAELLPEDPLLPFFRSPLLPGEPKDWLKRKSELLSRLHNQSVRLSEGLRLAFTLGRAGRSREAREVLVPLGEAHPKSALPAVLAGLYAIRRRDWSAALVSLQLARRAYPDCVLLLEASAEALRRLKRFDEALQVLEHARSLDPQRVRPFLDTAIVLYAKGEFQKALPFAEKVIQLQGATTSYRGISTYGSILDRLGRSVEAIRVFKKIARAHTDSANAAYNLGYALDGAHDFVGARAAYERAVRLDSSKTRAWLALAWLCSGSNREACPECRAWFETHPEGLDKTRAEEALLAGVRADGGRSSEILATAVAVARRIGQPGSLGALFDELSKREGISNSRLGRLTRFRRQLDR